MRARLLRHFLSLIALSGLVEADPLRVPIWPEGAPIGENSAAATLTVYLPEKPNGTAMIICPGGGYAGLVTGGEGRGIAEWLNSHGITGIVLEYRLPKGNHLVPILDAQRALRIARSKAKDWRFDPNRLGIIGFSAGGHLASTAITHFDSGEGKSTDPVQRLSCRPDFGVLIYPVISMGPLAYSGSRSNLLGPTPDPALIDHYSSEKNVTPDTPPTFLAHAKDDTVVSPENSRLFAEALRARRLPVEYLELPSGGHGLNGYKGPSWDAWQAGCLKWLAVRGFIPTQENTRIIPASDPQLLAGLSPLNWIRTPDSLSSPVCGASLRLAFRDTRHVALNLDTTRLRYPSPTRFPILAWTVNGGPLRTHQLAAGETSLSLADGIANPVIDLFVKGLSPFEDRFHGDIPANALTITGFTVDPTCRPVAPPAAKLWLNLGDSILSGDGAALAAKQGRPADDLWAASDDARASYGYLLAQHYGYRESRLAFGGYAWAGGGGNNPQVTDLIDQLTSTTSRLTEGSLQPCPDLVLLNLGENGAPQAATVINGLTRLRQRTSPQTRVLVMIPISGKARAEITAAVKSYLDTSKDPNTQLLDLGPLTFETCDGQHPTAAGHLSVYQAALPHLDKLFGKR